MQHFRRTICLLAAIAICLSCLPVFALAAESDTLSVGEQKQKTVTSGKLSDVLFTFTPTENGRYAFVAYSGNTTEFTIAVADSENVLSQFHSEVLEIASGACVFEAVSGKTYDLIVSATDIFGSEEISMNFAMERAADATGIRLSKSYWTGSVGETFRLIAQPDPLWADPEEYSWTSTDISVAQVDETGTVTAAGNGNAQIIVTSNSGLTAQCDVTVTTPQSVSFSCRNATGYVGERKTLAYQFQPYGTKESVTFSSSDPSVVQVIGDTVTFLRTGTATVTLTSFSGLTDTCVINVCEMDQIRPGDRMTLTIQPGDELRYQFVAEEPGEYALFCDSDAFSLKGSYYYETNKAWIDVTEAGEIVTVAIRNGYSTQQTGTIGLEKTVPTESISIPGISNGQTSRYPGERVRYDPVFYPQWAMYENITVSSSNPDVVSVDENYSQFYLNYNTPGSALITVSMPSGATTSFTAVCAEKESFTVGDVKTPTLGYQETAEYDFTPETSGYYYFYTPCGEFIWDPETETGYNDEFSSFYIYDGNWNIGSSFYTSRFSGAYAWLEAGQSYELTAENYWSAQVAITGDLYLAMPDQSGIRITGDTNGLRPGDWLMLNCQIAGGLPPAANSITWWVSDETVLRVDQSWNDQAYLEAINAGTATVTATTDDGRSASLDITVRPATTHERLDVLPHMFAALCTGDTFTMATSFGPEWNPTWTSSNPSVASVDQNGMVTAHSQGTAVITVTEEYGERESCTVLVSEDRADAENITLTLWAEPGEGEMIANLYPRFAESHPEWDIHLEVYGCNAGDALTEANKAPGSVADVFCYAGDQVSGLKNQNVLAPVSGQMLEQTEADNAPAMLDTLRDAQGTVYGLPYTANTWFLYYDKRVYSQEDVRSLETMLEKGIVTFPVSNSWYTGAFYVANGGTIFGPHGTDAGAGIRFGGTKGTEVTEYLVKLLQHSHFRNDSDGIGIRGLREGTVSACFSGSWDYAGLYDALGENLGVAQLPSITIGDSQKQLKAFATACAYGTNSNCTHPEAAQALALFLTSPEAQKARWNSLGTAPVSTALASDPEIQEDKLSMAQLSTILHSSIAQPSIPEMGHYWGPMSRMCSDLVSGVVTLENAAEYTEQMYRDMNPGLDLSEPLATGWSGNTQWTLTEDGVLTFCGEGNMKDYGWGGNQPWLNKGVEIISVVIENGVTAVGTGAFKDLTTLESVTLPESGLTRIGEAAFYGCTSLKELFIPDGVYTIWEYTFKNCTALEKIRLPKSLEKIDQGAFEACVGLTELFLPTNVKIIGAWSFKGCTGLKEADMQWADATEIRAGAFKNCTALTKIILPANIQVLGDSCFYGIGAEKFVVPATVKTIEDWCFARASVQKIIFEGDAPTIGEGAFNKISLIAYYPGDNATWTADVMQSYGGTITWDAN